MPAASGPRWRSRASMGSSSSRSVAAPGVVSKIPAMPHMAGYAEPRGVSADSCFVVECVIGAQIGQAQRRIRRWSVRAPPEDGLLALDHEASPLQGDTHRHGTCAGTDDARAEARQISDAVADNPVQESRALAYHLEMQQLSFAPAQHRLELGKSEGAELAVDGIAARGRLRPG